MQVLYVGILLVDGSRFVVPQVIVGNTFTQKIPDTTAGSTHEHPTDYNRFYGFNLHSLLEKVYMGRLATHHTHTHNLTYGKTATWLARKGPGQGIPRKMNARIA